MFRLLAVAFVAVEAKRTAEVRLVAALRAAILKAVEEIILGQRVWDWWSCRLEVTSALWQMHNKNRFCCGHY